MNHAHRIHHLLPAHTRVTAARLAETQSARVWRRDRPTGAAPHFVLTNMIRAPPIFDAPARLEHDAPTVCRLKLPTHQNTRQSRRDSPHADDKPTATPLSCGTTITSNRSHPI